ncbi:ribose-phosphate diphosphokinase [Candidatus Vidania fulgoroideorum]
MNAIILDKIIKKRHFKKFKDIKINCGYFSDGEINIIEKKLFYKRIFIVFYINNNIEKKLFKILMIIELLKMNGNRKIFLVLPFLRFSRQDKFKYTSPLKMIIKILEKLGLYMLITYDIHSTQTLGFSNKMLIRNYSLFPIFIKKIKQKNKLIVFSDIGSYNRYRKYIGNKEYIVLNKYRIDKKVKFSNNFKFKNKNCFIFDDIIDSGKTIIKSIKMLVRNKIKKIYVLSIHPVFSDISNFEKKIKKIKELKKIFLFKTLKKKIKSKKIFFYKIEKEILKTIYKCIK